MKMGNRILNANDVKKIEKLIADKVDVGLIADVMNVSKSTIRRIEKGEHFLQKKEEPASKKAENTVEEKLDEIIRLLTELVGAWR